MATAVLVGCLSLPAIVWAALPAPKLSSDTDTATAGFFRLSWTTDVGRVEVQEADNPEFLDANTSYMGFDRATLVSGKPDGIWYYRIRAWDEAVPGPWSAPVSVSVAHHPLSRAFTFLGLGVIVFIAIVLMIVRGPGKTA